MAHPGKMLNFRVTPELYEMMDLALRQHNIRTRGQQIGLSEWIRDAVRQKLDHLRRGRKSGRNKSYRCVHCGISKPLADISLAVKPLFGKTEYCCKTCNILQSDVN